MPDKSGDAAAAGGQVGRHNGADAAEPDKPDPTLDRLAAAGGLERSRGRRYGRDHGRIDVSMLHF